MKRKGITIVELIVAISILGIFLSLSVPKLLSRDKLFESTIYQMKSYIRMYSIKSLYSKSKYTINLDGKRFRVYRNFKKIQECNLPSDLFIVSKKEDINFNSVNRYGAPESGMTIYLFDSVTHRLERITIMLGSGRVMSYKDNYLEKKQEIDQLIKVR